MTPKLKEFEAMALRLSVKERARLTERLLASLDTLDKAENERLWVEEADRRYRAYRKGRIPARPAEEVFREAGGNIK